MTKQTELKRLITPAPPPELPVRVRFIRGTRMQDVHGARWDCLPGAELELSPQEARRTIALGDAIAITPTEE